MADEKQRVAITALAQLAPFMITVEIDMPDDTIAVVPMRELTSAEWTRVGMEVLDPAPPISGATKTGPIYDYNDPTYQQRRNEAATERSYRRLLASLTIEIDGDTVEAKIESLKNTLGYSVTRQLFAILNQLASESEARITDRARSFRIDGTPPVAGNGTARD